MNKFILPKVHLSYSQMQVWKSNPARYRREYFEAGKRLDTKYLQFGKGIAALVEELCDIEKTIPGQDKSCVKLQALNILRDRHGLDEGTYDALWALDTEGTSEFKIELLIHDVPFLMFIDKMREDLNVFREYKTGKIAWDKAKVQKHEQLVVYAVGRRAQTGKMPAYCDLDWLETSEKADESDDFWAKVDKKLKLTGKVKSFHREFDERELDRMEEKIVRVATEISVAYQAFLAEI